MGLPGSPVRAALCEAWWRRPFRKTPIAGVRYDLITPPGIVDVRLRSSDEDSFDQFISAAKAAAAVGASVHGGLPQKPQLPFRVGVPEINKRRATFKTILQKGGRLADMLGAGDPWTLAYTSGTAIGNLSYLYEPACRVFEFPESVAGIYSGWMVPYHPIGGSIYSPNTVDPSRTQDFSYSKGITRYIDRANNNHLLLPIGAAVGGDVISGYIDVQNTFMFDMDLRKLVFSLIAPQQDYFRLCIYLESTYPYSSGLTYTSAEKIGPLWRFYVGSSVAEWVLKNRLGYLIFAWLKYLDSLPGIVRIAPSLPSSPSMAQFVCDSGVIDAMPSPETGMSDFSLPSMEEVAPNVPAVLTPIDFKLFNSSNTTKRYDFPCVAVHGRDGLIHLVDTYEAVASLDASEQAAMLRIRRSLPNGDGITSLGWNLFTTKESVSLRNGQVGEYPSIDYSNDLCSFMAISQPYLDFGISRLYTGDSYEVVVNIPRGATTLAYLYFRTGRWSGAGEYRDVSGDKCYWVNGVFSYYEYHIIPSAPNYFQNVGGTPYLGYEYPPIPDNYFPGPPIGFPDGEQGLDIYYCPLFSTGDSVAYRWDIDSIFDLWTFKNAYDGFIIKCSIPYYSFTYSSVSSIVNESRHLFCISWLRGPSVPFASLSKKTTGVQIGDADPCEPCTFIFKSEGRSKIGTLTGRAVCVFNMDSKIGRIEQEGSDYFYVPLEQGIDWVCCIDEDNWIPVSVAVVVVETYLQSTTVKAMFGSVAAYSPRLAKQATSLIDTGADIPITIIGGIPKTVYRYETLLRDLRYWQWEPIYVTAPVITVGAVSYSATNRIVSLSLSSPPPYHFKAYLGWEAYVGGAESGTKEAYAILAGVEFECDDAGLFELDFSRTLYGLPANTTGLKVFIVDPRLGNIAVQDLPSLLTPQVEYVVPPTPSQAASNPASNAPVILP